MVYIVQQSIVQPLMYDLISSTTYDLDSLTVNSSSFIRIMVEIIEQSTFLHQSYNLTSATVNISTLSYDPNNSRVN